MKKSHNIVIKIFYGYFLLVVFLLLSCENKDRADGNVPGEDSLYLASIHGEEMQTYNERLAEQNYLHYCAACHGPEGKGDGFNAANLEQKPPDFTDGDYMKLLTHEYLVQAILVGGKVINKSPLMPVWGKTLTEDDIQRLAIYVRGFAGDDQED